MPLATAEIAWIAETPKQGQYGSYQSAKFKLTTGEEKWINYSPGAKELDELRQLKSQGSGMVTLYIDEKGKAKLVDNEKPLDVQAPAAAPTTAASARTPLNQLWDDDAKRRVAEFTKQEAKLLRYIWDTVGETFGDVEHTEETQRAITNSIYIQVKRDMYR